MPVAMHGIQSRNKFKQQHKKKEKDKERKLRVNSTHCGSFNEVARKVGRCWPELEGQGAAPGRGVTMPKTVWKGPCPLTRKRELVPIGRNGFASDDDLRLSSKRGNRAEKKGNLRRRIALR